MKETGVEVEQPPLARFREHLLSGEWREVRVLQQTESSEILNTVSFFLHVCVPNCFSFIQVYKDLDEMKRSIESPEAIAVLYTTFTIVLLEPSSIITRIFTMYCKFRVHY